MASGDRLSCYVIGSESLLVQCGQIWLDQGNEIRGVITGEAPIRQWAEQRGIAVIEPGSDWLQTLQAAEAFDYFFSIAYLAMIPEAVLGLPTRLPINFHDGPLPEYAGLNVPCWALLRGETQHGVTWHVMTAGADEGDLLVERRFDISPGERALTLNTKCFEAGIDSFGELVGRLGEGDLPRTPQDFSTRSYFARSDRPVAAGMIDFGESAEQIARGIRALDFGSYANPLGSAKLWMGDFAAVVGEVEVLEDASSSAPGTVVLEGEGVLRVSTASSDLLLRRLALLDGHPIDANELLARARLEAGGVLPSLGAAEREALTELTSDLARYESLWTRRLLNSTPLQLPFAESAGAGNAAASPQRLTTSLPPSKGGVDGRVAELVAYLARIGGTRRFDLSFRDRALNERIAGFEALHASRVPLRVALHDTQSVADLRGNVAAELARVRKRGSYLLDVAARTPELSTARGQALAPPTAVCLEISDQPAEVVSVEGSTLTLAIDPAGRELHWIFDERVLERSSVESMQAQLMSVIEAAADADGLWSALPLYSQAERQRMLVDWNDTAAEFPRDLCIHQLFEQCVRNAPEARAVAFEGQTISYAELDRRANQLAHHLQALGVGPDVFVGLCIERSVEMVVGMLGIQKAGGAYLPLDPAFPTDRIAFMVQDAAAPVLLTQDSLLAALPKTEAKLVSLDGDLKQIAQQASDAPPCAATSQNLAYVIYTSGSTGLPKGVQVEHGNVVNFFAGMDERIANEGPGVWLAVTSLSFDISVLELLWTLSRGFEVVIHAETLGEGSGAASAHASRPIDFSLFYFASDASADERNKYRLLLEGARFADENGFAAVWTPERHFHDFGGLYPNPSVTGAAVAAITEHVGIRSGSVVLPLHEPIRVAEEWSVVDNISGGRVGISFAAGWQPNDFVLKPENFADAKTLMFEQIETVKALWRGEELTFPGPKGDVKVRTLPRPVQPELPIWITSAGNAETFAMAGEIGAYILTHLLGQTLDQLLDKITAYRDAWKAAGHPGKGHVSLMLHTFVGDGEEDELRELVREPMKSYLGSAMSLVKEAAFSFPTFQKRQAQSGQSLDDIFAEGFSDEEKDALLDFAFERYFDSSGLFGTPENCMTRVNELRGVGVDEIACLIDFGVPTDIALENLKNLGRLREISKKSETVEGSDQSIPALIDRHEVTHFQCTPSMARMLLMDEAAPAALGKLQTMLLGGEALPVSLAQELATHTSAKLLNMYGPTETTIWSSSSTVEAGAESVTIGRPIANTQLYIVDEELEPQPIGVPGELLIGGDGVVRGYLNRPELNAERFVPDPFRDDPEARLYRTGDLARYREDGVVEFLGRIDHQVKLRGYRIELGEIESVLNQHSSVQEAVVIAREDTPGDQRLVAYCVPVTRQHIEAGALREALAAVVPEYMVPAHFVELDRFPLTPNAKIDRKALPAPERATSARVESAPPEGELEQKIASIWQDLLAIDGVGLDENFFDLGGHSLLAVQMHRALRDGLDASLSITDIFRLPTIRLLAEHLSGGSSGPSVGEQATSRAESRKAAMQRRRPRRKK